MTLQFYYNIKELRKEGRSSLSLGGNVDRQYLGIRTVMIGWWV